MYYTHLPTYLPTTYLPIIVKGVDQDHLHWQFWQGYLMRDGIFLSTSSSSEGVYSVCGGSRKAYQTQRRQTLFITCQLPFHNIVLIIQIQIQIQKLMKYCKHFITCQLQRNKLQKLEDTHFKQTPSAAYVFRTGKQLTWRTWTIPTWATGPNLISVLIRCIREHFHIGQTWHIVNFALCC